MKTIYLVRHAKAEEKTIPGKDFDRALTSKGISDSIMMGKRLASMHIQPGIIVSSPAQRALQTAKIVKENINHSGELILNENIYYSKAEKLIEIIKNTEENIQSIMLVGHNPSFNELMHYLCNTNIDNISKAGIVGIKLTEKKWEKISHKCGILLFYNSPKT